MTIRPGKYRCSCGYTTNSFIEITIHKMGCDGKR